MAYPCRICTSPHRAAIDAAMSEPGISDCEISRQFGIPQSSVQRHRTRHVIKPMQDKLAIIARDTAEQRQRQELAREASSNDPSIAAQIEARLGMKAQMAKLDRIEARLERMAEASEQAGSPIGVSQVSSQQLRAIETGAKLGGIGGYKPVSAIPQGAERNVVSITFEFPNAKHTETIGFVGKVVDGDVTDPSAIPDDLPRIHPNQQIARDAEGKTSGAYWSFEKLPDKPADDDGDQS
jgi:hypothetical protein